MGAHRDGVTPFETRLALAEKHRLANSHVVRGCTMCGGLGWILDCNDIGKPGPRMVELLPCLIPDCEASGQPVQNLSFAAGVQFTEVSRHPRDGFVMSISRGAL